MLSRCAIKILHLSLECAICCLHCWSNAGTIGAFTQQIYVKIPLHVSTIFLQEHDTIAAALAMPTLQIVHGSAETAKAACALKVPATFFAHTLWQFCQPGTPGLAPNRHPACMRSQTPGRPPSSAPAGGRAREPLPSTPAGSLRRMPFTTASHHTHHAMPAAPNP